MYLKSVEGSGVIETKILVAKARSPHRGIFNEKATIDGDRPDSEKVYFCI